MSNNYIIQSDKLIYFDKINSLLKIISNKGEDYCNSRTVNDPRISDVATYIKTDIPNLLAEIIADNTYIIKGSIGAGIVTKTPWIAIMDKRITDTTQQGVYLVILFSEDLKTPYLSLAMGTTEPGKLGFRLKPIKIKAKADDYRSVICATNSLLRTTPPDVADKGYKACSIYNTIWNYNTDDDKPLLLSSYINLYRDNFNLFKDKESIDSSTGDSENIQYYWVNANPALLQVDKYGIGERQQYTSRGEKGHKRKDFSCFEAICEGDKFVCYETGSKRIKAFCTTTHGLQKNAEGEDEFEFEISEHANYPVTLDELRNYLITKKCEALKHPQGSLFKLTEEQYNEIKKMANHIPESKKKMSLADELLTFKTYLKKNNLVFNETFIDRFMLSLKSKPFVILSGLTGSGKTQLALAYAKWKRESEQGEYQIVPVGADWTNREYLLGYPNALQPEEYVKPNGVLDLLIEANNNPNKDFFLILDEMNMSYVERYFSDFLSAMESGEAIPLWEGKPEVANSDVPEKITLPKNFYIIGTVNIDETTYMFSPKVLDRAFVLEFHIEKKDMETFLDMVAPDFKVTLLDIFEQLAKINAEFGYRTAKEMSDYMANAKLCGMLDDDILDAVIMQKLLPKVHGSRKKITPILMELWEICFNDKDANIDALKDFPEDKTPRYPISAKKIWRMYQILQDNGFVSFAEA